MKSDSMETLFKGKIINLFFFSLFLPVLCLVTHSCPTLWDPMDCSPPDASVHGIPQAKNTGVGCHPLLQGIFRTQGSNPSLSHCRWFFTIWAALFFSLSFSVYLPFPKFFSLAQSARKSIRWEARMPWVCTLLNHQPNSLVLSYVMN